MQKWEYQIVLISRKAKGIFGPLADWDPNIDMQKMGETGWELVSVVPIAGDYASSSGVTTQIAFYFKRPQAE